MTIKFRTTSIRSRKRTIGLAGFGLLVEAVISHPRFDTAAIVNVALMSRFAAAPLAASLSNVTRTGGPRPADPVVATPVSGPDHLASLCAKARRVES